MLNIQAPTADAAWFSHFDQPHWNKVRQARRQLGLAKTLAKPVDAVHALTGQRLVECASGRIYQILHVQKDWLNGWFFRAMLDLNGSHRVCFIDNISCANGDVLAQIEQFKLDFVRAS